MFKRTPEQKVERRKKYAKEEAAYSARPEIREKRSDRNKARRVMEKKLGTKLPTKSEVDHKNGNALDNSPGNLQVLSRRANRVKGHNKAK